MHSAAAPPAPLERPLLVRRDTGTLIVSGDDLVILEATPSSLDAEPSFGADELDEVFRSGPAHPPADHVAPECSVCGRRADGLGIHPRPLGDTDLWATVWSPDSTVSADGTTVSTHVVWGALDCPAEFAVTRSGRAPLTFFPAVVRLTATLRGPIVVDRPVAVISWPTREPERRVDGATAIVDENRTVLAHSEASHARLPLDFASP